MPVRPHLTFANVAAGTALVVSLTGGGVAVAAGLAKNSVGSPQIKNNAVKGADVKESSLGKVRRAKVADRAASAASADNVLAMTFDSTGAVVPERSGAGVTAVRGSEGRYFVTFPRSVRECALFATPTDPGSGNAADVLANAHQSASADNEVYVGLFDGSGFTDFGASVLVVC